MPMHDWTRVTPGIFHAFHHQWISTLSSELNSALPPEYYALPEQQAAGFGPDVLALQVGDGDPQSERTEPTAATVTRTQPRTRFKAESDSEFYRRRKSTIVVRHVSGDRIVAMLEIVSPGNKSTRHAFRAFVDKVCEPLEHRIHLLIVDPFPPGPRDPNGVHAAIWGEVQDEPYVALADEPLMMVAYECGRATRAHIEPVAVGMVLPSMPLILEPEAHILVPLEATYLTAFNTMPQRWRAVLEQSAT